MKRKVKIQRPKTQKRKRRLTRREVDSRDAAMVRMLLRKLKSPNRKAKASALRALVVSADLARSEGRALRASVFKKCLESKDILLVAWAAEGLGRIKEKSSANALIECVRSDHKGLKYNATWALAELGEIKAVRPIIAYGLTEEPDSGSTENAKLALKKLIGVNRDFVIRELTIWGLRSRNELVRKNSEEILKEFHAL
jgi:HEAT repeat protein